ncbi:NAD-dependent epimerase/dehydratase family protein [Niabella terrae]
MTILLTGTSGFLGSIFLESLRNDGFKVFLLNEMMDEHSDRVDIVSPFSFNNKVPIDMVIHIAGKAHSIPRTKEDAQLFFDVNFNGTKNLCSALEGLDQKPTAFVFVSTVAVYGLESGDLIHEETPLNGSTPYAKSKILAESFLTKWAIENRVKVSILRLPLIAGPKPPGNLGQMILGIQKGRYLNIGGSPARKSIVWGGDVAKLAPKLLYTSGIFNLTDRRHPNFDELSRKIALALGKKKPKTVPTIVGYLMGKIGDLVGERFPINSLKIRKLTSSLTFNDDKAVKELGWEPSSVLDKVYEMI